MRLFTAVAALRCYLGLRRAIDRLEQEDASDRVPYPSPAGLVGLVPTMGALHDGHLSLIERARQENTTVIVTIFVNPLQFGPTEDYQHYPRTSDRDRQLCEQAGVDVVFAPTVQEMGVGSSDSGVLSSELDLKNSAPRTPHPALFTQVVPPAAMTSKLCGKSRPGHFQGVATIVTKLLNLIQPDRAYFGQKDAQQLAIIQRLVTDLNLPVEVVGCPTVREASGLAFSSRNQYLTAEQKAQAAGLYRSLQQAEKQFHAGDRHSSSLIEAVKTELAHVPSVQPEYVELVHPATLVALEEVEEVGMLAIAAHVGAVRLIDNVLLRSRRPIVAIDGPAGAGKSTVARQVAQILGLLYLNSGAMYRALTWLVLQLEIPLEDQCAIAEVASQCQIRLTASDEVQSMRVWINDQEVTGVINTLEVTSNVSAIAAQPAVRQALLEQQQRWGQKGGLVAEGRDIGTRVFPDAELKIFLTASVQERARRRQQDFQQGQIELTLAQLERDIAERDWKDSTRDVSPLQKAADAIEISTDGLSVAEVTARIVSCYHKRLTE